MGLRINTNIAGIRSARLLRSSTLDLNKSLERLSSGLRINRAGDDAAGLAIAEGFRSVRRGSDVAARNAQDGISLVQTAEGALSTTTEMLQRIRELAVQAANDTNSAQNRTDLQAEVTQLIQQIDQIANNTEFNGVRPLDGSVVNILLHVGPRAGQTINVGLPAASTFAVLTGGGVVDLSTQANANATITTMDNALIQVNTRRSTLGAVQNRLEFTIATLQIQSENAAASESAIRDADIAQETIQFTRNQILVSAGTSVLAQANVVPQTALQLLGGA